MNRRSVALLLAMLALVGAHEVGLISPWVGLGIVSVALAWTWYAMRPKK
jgi:hypothetical protein